MDLLPSLDVRTPTLTFIAVVDGRQEGDVCVGQDDADVHKGLVLGKQAPNG